MEYQTTTMVMKIYTLVSPVTIIHIPNNHMYTAAYSTLTNKLFLINIKSYNDSNFQTNDNNISTFTMDVHILMYIVVLMAIVYNFVGGIHCDHFAILNVFILNSDVIFLQIWSINNSLFSDIYLYIQDFEKYYH